MRQHLALQFLCFLALLLLCTSPAAAQEDFQTIPASDSVLKNPPRAAITLYCNITGACSACKPQHMQAEACRATGHAEKLTCSLDKAASVTHQVSLRVHRRIDTGWQPLHISRSCPPPAGTPAAASASAPTTQRTDPQAVLDPGITQLESDTTTTDEGGGSSSSYKPHPRQVYFEGSQSAGVGGLNVLYFELGMLLVLSGALPVVYVRKRRYIRL